MNDAPASAALSRSPAGASALPLMAEHVSLTRGGRTLIGDVTLTVGAAPGVTVLMGPNGAGKSLMARILANLIVPDSGRVLWDGRPPDRERQRAIGFVFQKPVLLYRSALANVAFAIEAAGFAKREAQDRAHAALAMGGLTHLAEQPARTLSGGEQQRLALVRALACEPQIVILDEPCANLDPSSAAAIETQIRNASDSGTAILLISHDLAQARRLGRRLIVLHEGRVLEDGDAADVLAHPRTRAGAQFIRGELIV